MLRSTAVTAKSVWQSLSSPHFLSNVTVNISSDCFSLIMGSRMSGERFSRIVAEKLNFRGVVQSWLVLLTIPMKGVKNGHAPLDPTGT